MRLCSVIMDLPCHEGVTWLIVLYIFMKRNVVFEVLYLFFFLNDTPPTEISPLSLHDALPISQTLSWPFFEEHHRRFAEELARWADATLPGLPHDNVDRACRARVKALGKAGFLKACVPSERSEEHTSELQSRSDLVCRLLLEKK